MWKLLLAIPWIAAGGLAWWYTETNGSRLKKQDATLYDEIANDKDGTKKKELKDKLPDDKKHQEQNKTKLEELKKKNESEREGNHEEQVKELEDIIAKKEVEIQIAESIDGKLWMPVLSISNIAWAFGIFFGVGIIGHFIFKQIIKLFAGEKTE